MNASTALADLPLRQAWTRWSVEGTAKVQRGGSYLNGPYRLRASFRTKGDPTEHAPNVGVRCAQDVPTLP